jgi:hypothetical protein
MDGNWSFKIGERLHAILLGTKFPLLFLPVEAAQ